MIPKVIHQTWRDREVPEAWRKFQRSWKRHHPDWDYRLWTDLDLRRLICEQYPWFLSIYDNYSQAIQRVDAARYFLMHRYGGIYADLDYECLRPFEPLLNQREVVLAYEPGGHLKKPVIRMHGFTEVAGNALLASVRGHIFWEHIFLELVGSHRISDPLSSTGPLFLTRALETFAYPNSITCLPANLLYPGTSMEGEKGLLQNAGWRSAFAKEAYGIHHWKGSWTHSQRSEGRRTQLPFMLAEKGKPILDGNCFLDSSVSASSADPLVSALMVTSPERLEFVKRAVACFQAQTYSAKELIIVDDGDSDELRSFIEALGALPIVYVKANRANLGALRNLAVSRASGDYVMQWDDDDLYHPQRISAQMAVLRRSGADACLLSRWQIWWPGQHRIATSKRRGWEGSVLCLKGKLPPYDEMRRRGEDTPAILRLASRSRVAFLDAPWLYIYVVHGTNTTPADQLEEHWKEATEFHWGQAYGSILRRIASELPEEIQAQLVARLDSGSPEPGSPAFPRLKRPEAPIADPLPRVLILSPVKDGTPFIETYVTALKRLDYPRQRISLGLLESDSQDGTFELLSKRLPELRSIFARVDLFKRDYLFRPTGHRTDTQRQLQRRSILARSRNYLLTRALREEDWVLWLDFDVIDYPADVIQQLLSKEKDIIVPHCVLAPGGRTFDLNTFIQDPKTPEETSEDMILQPPKGLGRRYLDSMRDRELVEVDAVGGTMLLVKADLHREGLLFPTVPYKRYIETEGLSFLGRDMGVQSWSIPRLEVVHANH